MRARKAIAAGGIGASVVIALSVLLSARTLCACTSVEENLQYAIGVSPIRDPDSFRVSLLKKLPPGASLDEAYLLLGASAVGFQDPKDIDPEDRSRVMQSMQKKCVKDTTGVECRVLLETKWLGFNEVGFGLHLGLDDANRLTDLRLYPYSVWGGG
jgi:hypothetical protein